MIHHELKTPITSIKGYAQLMQRRGAYSERATQAIVTQANHLTSVVNDLLDMLCLEETRREPRREPVDLTRLAQAAVAQAGRRSDRHTIQLEAPPQPLVGHWDQEALSQILERLLSNAIRFSPAGTEILVRVAQRADEAVVSVMDQGVGIPPVVLPRVFERFYRVDDASLWPAQGLGLGLYCAKLLVEAHGGRIWAESAPSRGSNFFFSLPLVAPPGNGTGCA